MDRDPSSKVGNLLLDDLRPNDRAELLEDAHRVPIEIGHPILSPGDLIVTVCFPISGTLSLVAQPDDGRSVEAATIGREGMGSVHSALGSRIAGQLLVGQVPGEIVMVPVDTFAAAASKPGRFQRLIFGYIEASFTQAALGAACNALHHVDQRCARWLLMTHDRVDAATFELRQEFLAYMLGVQRPTVSVAASTLASAGLITYRRGVITILDREGLEAAACSCYEQIRAEYSRLVPLNGHSA